MRIVALLFLPVLLLPWSGSALAQVTTNDKALEALQPPAPPAKATPAAPATKSGEPAAAPNKANPTPAKPAAHHTPRKAASAQPAAKAPLPKVPLAPPPNLVLAPPPPALPQHEHETPPPVPVKPDAIGTVTKIAGGAQLTFGPGSSDLNDATHAELIEIAGAARADKQLIVTITAWAPGTEEDPSTPRRLSLDRALAARAVLIHEGVESERVQAVAKGFVGIGDGNPDRLEIVAAHPRSTPEGKPR
jgi:outer membrane protein OmpA-like peptidoglycan-associated protein